MPSPNYWDGLHNGLLAGERLSADLERMDIAYLERNVREYELTRHISLMLLDPMAVERLKVDGECYFSLPEALFDWRTRDSGSTRSMIGRP